MATLGLWILQNHPYQYVYFNILARPHAEENFDLDYWGVGMENIVRELLRRDEEAKINVAFFNPDTAELSGPETLTDRNLQVLSMLTAEEKARIIPTSSEPDYIVMFSRGHINKRRSIEGYQKIFNITVDGYEIDSLWKRAN